jgi:hypothetical protein
MAYQAFDPIVFPLLLFYTGLVIFSVLLTVELYKKWRERKAKPVMLMTALFTVFAAALVSLAIGLVDSVISGFYREVYRFSLPLAYSLIVVADIILFLFAREITGHWGKALKPVAILGAFLCVVLFLPWNWWGHFNTDYAGQINIRMGTMAGLIAYSYTVYIMIARVCREVMPEAKTPVARAGLHLLFGAMIVMIIFFLMFVIDTVPIVAFHSGGYSVFVYIGWVVSIAFFVCMYLSVAMPAWFLKWITRTRSTQE